MWYLSGVQIELPNNGFRVPLFLLRYMLGLSVLPAVLQFIGFLFLPESPRWLIQRGLTQKARRVLSQIRGNQNIDEEYDSIKNSLDEEDSGGGKSSGETGHNRWMLFLALKEPRWENKTQFA